MNVFSYQTIKYFPEYLGLIFLNIESADGLDEVLLEFHDDYYKLLHEVI